MSILNNVIQLFKENNKENQYGYNKESMNKIEEDTKSILECIVEIEKRLFLKITGFKSTKHRL